MKFYIIEDYVIEEAKNYPSMTIPVDEQSELMPLYYLFSETRLWSNDHLYDGYGVQKHNNVYYVYCVHIDKIDHYKKLYEEAKDSYETRIYIEESDITTLKYTFPKLYTSFPDKLAKEKLLKESAKELILEHLNIEKQLNMELI